jgi:hypothetical protein
LHKYSDFKLIRAHFAPGFVQTPILHKSRLEQQSGITDVGESESGASVLYRATNVGVDCRDFRWVSCSCFLGWLLIMLYCMLQPLVSPPWFWLHYWEKDVRAADGTKGAN